MRKATGTSKPSSLYEKPHDEIAAGSHNDPFALVHTVSGSQRLYCLNDQALAIGLKAGIALTDARALHPGLQVAEADPDGDAKSLDALALWAIRYSPWVNVCRPDGLWIDITGAAHLLGGEAAVMQDIKSRLRQAGIRACIATAETAGGAWALARFHPRGITGITIPAGQITQALTDLPIQALRIDDRLSQTLYRLGLKQIGDISALPRVTLERRFRDKRTRSSGRLSEGSNSHIKTLLIRLDQALGYLQEPLSPISEPPRWRVRQSLLEPITDAGLLEQITKDLLPGLLASLEKAEQGVRRLALIAYRVDGTTDQVIVGSQVATQEAGHILRLLKDRYETIDPGFGIDLVMLTVIETALMRAQQQDITGGSKADDATLAIAKLTDRIKSRVGPASVQRPVHHHSYLPERVQRLSSDLSRETGWDNVLDDISTHRPIRLLIRPEPLDVMAEIPEGPPISFTWRRLLHKVRLAEGPERLSSEWWFSDRQSDDMPFDQKLAGAPRDYYHIEDRLGRRFWLFRLGLYSARGLTGAPNTAPRWYMHGLF